MPNVHFIGICGVGMSAVAKLLQDLGWQISGSDEGFYPPISDYLTQHGIPCQVGYAARNIPPEADLIIIGKHARLTPEENDEVRAAFSSGKTVQSYPELLQTLTADSDNYVIAGSFGKSSCTALAAWILVHAGKDPSYVVGALSPSLGDNARRGRGPAFVLEGDEYPAANWDSTSKFLYYNARHVLLTSCEHDHVNVFPTLEDYLQPFRKLVAQTSVRTIVACLEGAHVRDVLQEAAAPIITYSQDRRQADWYAQNVRHVGAEVHFELTHRGRSPLDVSSKLIGAHNIQNIVGVGALLLGTGAVSAEELAAGIAGFEGVRRRMELKTTNSHVPLYEDFGSSRAKLLAGIRALREHYPDRRLHVVFEPHTFSFRNRNALEWYDDLFTDADEVSVFEPPTHGAASHDQLSLEEIVARVAGTGTWVQPVRSKEELLTLIGPRLVADRSAVLIETSGPLGGAIPELTDYLDRTYR